MSNIAQHFTRMRELNPTPVKSLPSELAEELQANGHLLLRNNSRLFISRASELSEAHRAALKQDKTALLPLAQPCVIRDGKYYLGSFLPQVSSAVPDEATGASRPAEWNVGERGQEFGAFEPATGSPTSQAFAFSSPSPTSGSLAQFLQTESPRSTPDWQAQEPPDLSNIHDIILNFETNGLDWAHGDRPVGVTIGSLDGQMKRYLPFAHRGGGNLDEETVKRWAREQLKGKHITNVNTRFDVHMSREWGVDLEEQGNTVSDVQHYAALLDDNRAKFRKDGLKPFAIDTLAKDFLGGIEVQRVDESNMAEYPAHEVASRAEYQAQLVSQLRSVMWPLLDAEELQEVRQLEDDVIYPVVEMEKNGALLDMELLEKYSAECTSKHSALMIEIAQEAGFGFDHTNSNWQRLFEHCHLTPSDSYAEEIVGPIEHPLIRKAHLAGQYASLNSKTFAAYKKQVGPDGVLRFDINQLRGDEGGTVSGRFSIGYVQQVPNHDNHAAVFGENLFPRRVFIPDRTPIDGWVPQYLDGDAAQVEYRLFAHFANNEKTLQAYREDPWLSFHKMTWARMKEYKPDMLYSHQKNFNFAKQYGARSIKLAVMMGFITKREGEEIRAAKRWNDPRLKQIHEIEAAYRLMMPEGDLLLDRASHLAKSTCDEYCKRGDELHRLYKHRGYVKTITGRRSRFPTNFKTYIGLNRVLQGSGADIMKKKITILHKARRQTGYLMRMTVHDSLGGDARTPETLAKVREILNEQSYPHLKVPILWDCKTGDNWAECK